MPDDRREYQSILLPVSFGGLHCRNGPFEDTDFVDLHHNRMQCILQTGRNLLLRDPHRISGNGIWRYPVYRNPGPGILYVCLFMQYIVFLPYVTIQGDWGRIIGTLAYTNAAGQYGYMFVIPTGIMEMYSAPNGVLLSFVLLFASCFFIHEIRQYIWAYWEKRLGQNCADEVHMRVAAANLRTDSDG